MEGCAASTAAATAAIRELELLRRMLAESQMAQAKAEAEAEAERAEKEAERAEKEAEKVKAEQALLYAELVQAEAERAKQHHADTLDARLKATLSECIICMDATSDTVLDPCMHLCCCSGCAKQLQECPQCREPVEYRKRVYVS